MSSRFKPASAEELAARGIGSAPAAPEVVEEAPVEAPAEEAPAEEAPAEEE